MRTPRILVACEYSGMVRDAFAARGWDAWSCDLLESERPGGQHYQGDVRDILQDGWDAMVGHPDCTYLTNSGAKWLYEEWTQEERFEHVALYLEANGMTETFNSWTAKQQAKFIKRIGKTLAGHSPRPDLERWRKLEEAAAFYRLLWEQDHIPYIALENPVMHGHAIKRVGGRATQFVQPYEYGTPESKRTGLRLKNLPKLTPNEGWEEVLAYGKTLPKKVFERVHNLPPSPTRWKERSRTFPGIAQAMADQWGPYIEARIAAEEEQAA